jgi:hypothetical protein
MNDSNLESRIQCLEGQLKRQRWVSAVILLIAAAAVGLAATTTPVSDEVRTKKLLIVNDNGQKAIQLSSGKYGGTLELFRGEGDTAVLIAAVRQSGGELVVKSYIGEERTAIKCDKTDAPISVLVDGKMHPLSVSAK